MVTIPAVRISVNHPLGEISHVVFDEVTRKIKHEGQVKVSPRCSERVVQLENGEKFIITARRTCPRPSEVDGVLREDEDGSLKWLSHSKVAELESQVQSNGWGDLLKDIGATWDERFIYRQESSEKKGLRPPQLGALHSIGAHWSISSQPATIVMPTGTGKTETMLATLVALQPHSKLLVVVPNKALLAQTANKFRKLGLLRSLGCIPQGCKNPVVGTIRRQPTAADQLDIFDNCHVILATASAISYGEAQHLLDEVAKRTDLLILDEAHHLPSRTWTEIRTSFKERRVLQFTATPFRRDGKPVEGKTIFEYPLQRAQEDGYFKPIRFEPVFQVNEARSDEEIATAAIAALDEDRRRGLDHVLLARCKSVARAADLFEKLYKKKGKSYNPVLVHSKTSDAQESIEKLKSRESRIVVCVDMFGEGFDLPQLKIAAIHDSQKSISTLLQFTGRFTRTSGSDIGDARIIANVANQDFNEALSALYAEDSDWNYLLRQFSAQGVREHLKLSEFLAKCKRLDDEDQDEETADITASGISPKFSTLAFRVAHFTPKRFYEGLRLSGLEVRAAWLNTSDRTLFFVTKRYSRVTWGRSRNLTDRTWDLFVVYYNAKHRTLFIHVSDNSIDVKPLAEAVGGTIAAIDKNAVFRCLGSIKRLMFQQVGLKKHGGRRNLRYSMYSGTDVNEALSPSHTRASTKSNVSGTGFEGGQPVTIGCSYKGRIWSREKDSVQAFTEWADHLAEKLSDQTINVDKIIANVLIPKPVGELPEKTVLCLDWPIEIYQKNEDKVVLRSSEGEFPFSQYGIRMDSYERATGCIVFTVFHKTHAGAYELVLHGQTDSEEDPPTFQILHKDGERFDFLSGSRDCPLEEWLNEHPPDILFVDGSELMGCDLVELPDTEPVPIPVENLSSWDWQGINIREESMWKGGSLRTDSVQHKAYEQWAMESPDVLFNDDGAGEAADLVSLKEEANSITLDLIHCKFSHGPAPGERIADLTELCAQAIRSSRWMWHFERLGRHLLSREQNLKIDGGADSRFLVGGDATIRRLIKASKFKPIKTRIVIVQPGLQISKLSESQRILLASTHGYLLDTVNTGLEVVGSP